MSLKKYNLTATHTDCGPIFMKTGQNLFQSLLLMTSQLVDFDEESLDLLGEKIKSIYGLDVNDKDSLEEEGLVTKYEDTHRFRVWSDGIRQYLSSNDKEKKVAKEAVKDYPYFIRLEPGTQRNIFTLANDKRETVKVEVVKTQDRGYTTNII